MSSSTFVEIGATERRVSKQFRRHLSFAVYSLFDPVSNDDTKDIQGKFDGDELSTGFVLGSLGGPDWNNSIEHSCTPSVDETGADHPRMVLGRSLESSTEDGPTSSKSDRLDAAITVTEPTTNETADEGTEIIDGNNATLEKGVVDDRGTCFGVGMTELHGGVVIVNCTVDTTHHTLIISEEEDGETSNTVDGDEKATLLKLVDHIGPRNKIHNGNYPECLLLDVLLLDYWEKRLGALLDFGEAESGKEGLKRVEEVEERLDLRCCGMGEGSYTRDSTHVRIVLPSIPHWGNVEMHGGTTRHPVVPRIWDGNEGPGFKLPCRLEPGEGRSA